METAHHILFRILLSDEFSIKVIVVTVQLSCFLRRYFKLLRATECNRVYLREMLLEATFLSEGSALNFLFST